MVILDWTSPLITTTCDYCIGVVRKTYFRTLSSTIDFQEKLNCEYRFLENMKILNKFEMMGHPSVITIV